MRNLKTVFKTTFMLKENNRVFFLQLSFFALLAMMSPFSGQALAQGVCSTATTVTEEGPFRGGIASFSITSAADSVTVEHAKAGTGLESLTVVGTPVNAIVDIPKFTPGTYDPVTVTFTAIDPNLAVDFTLRAANTYNAANINNVRARCNGPTPTPGGCGPTPTPPNPTPTPILTSFSGQGISVTGTHFGTNGVLNDTGFMSSNLLFFKRVQAPAGVLYNGVLTTGNLDTVAQAAFDQSRSQAIVENLTYIVNGNTITAAVIPVSSQCTCPAANTPPDCLGGLLMDGFFFNGTFIPSPTSPNTVFIIPAANGGGTITFDERILTGSGNNRRLIVNGAHVRIPGIVDVIFSQANSGIFCGSNV